MKRIFLSLAAAALCSAAQLRAEEKQPANQNAGDSVRMYRLQEVEVTATRATPTTPVAYSDIRREEIARNSYGTDIPTLLALTPSMIATNETGIGIGGTARKIKKMYIGVGGKARLCYSAEADKFGTATPLSKYRIFLAGTTVGGYALFGGGGYDSDAKKGEAIMDAYNASLTRTTAASLSVARQGLTAITLGNHALFVGGRSGDTSFGTVDVYDDDRYRAEYCPM